MVFAMKGGGYPSESSINANSSDFMALTTSTMDSFMMSGPYLFLVPRRR